MTNLFYTVQPGDVAEGLFGIAHRLYGDPGRWPVIYEANRAVIGSNPSVVRTGQQLMIPALELGAGARHVPRTYLVELADLPSGLAGIAQRLWDAPERWPELYAVNRGAIGDDPAALHPGQHLIVP